MRPGHEQCRHSYDEQEIGTYANPRMRVYRSLNCYHDHESVLHASDDLGIEYPVGKFCECCDQMTESWQA